jgi:hypothetical protein
MANKIIDDTECIQEWRTLVGEGKPCRAPKQGEKQRPTNAQAG